jgi:hypothetical protein
MVQARAILGHPSVLADVMARLGGRGGGGRVGRPQGVRELAETVTAPLSVGGGRAQRPVVVADRASF